MLKRVTVGVGDLAVSNKESEELITFSLGSCVGVTIWDRTAKVAGLLQSELGDTLGNTGPNASRGPESRSSRVRELRAR